MLSFIGLINTLEHKINSNKAAVICHFDIKIQLIIFTSKYTSIICVQQEKLNGLILQKGLDL